jgi:EmrB/QacA subfamily drug resistance transporter
MLIAARVLQGTGAALMMPNTIAIVSQVFPEERRGSALGILAGGSAFFAALGPLLGGVLAGVDWRLIFVVNAVLTLITVFLTLRSVPETDGQPGQRLDYRGIALFGMGIASFIFGLSQFAQQGASVATTYPPIIFGLGMLALFVFVELRIENPLIKLRLLKDRNFAAANLSQVIAGAIELGLGFLLPFQLLLIVGLEPAVAGIALLPASLPIIFAGPLAGKAFDKFNGRGPMTVGYLVLAASGVALAMATSNATALSLAPGLILQGIGLGIVLTVNDPVGLGSVPAEDSGEAAGMINTSEQLGGAIGIAAFTAIELGHYYATLDKEFAAKGINPNPEQVREVHEYVMAVEQHGYANVHQSKLVEAIANDLHLGHIAGFEWMFYAAAGVAVIGAIASWWMIRPGPPLGIEVRSRRMRWVIAGLRVGRTD